MARGNGGKTVFHDALDFFRMRKIIAEVKAKKPFKLYAYCLMTNHFHMVMEFNEFPIWTVMQRIMLRFSKYSNKRRKEFGHVFQARYKAKLCEKQSYLLKLLQYVHLNPVEAHMCKGPEDWKWSGHHDYLRPDVQTLVDTAFPLSLFHDRDPQRARDGYVDFIRSGIGNISEDDFETEPGIPCLGSPEFIGNFLELAQRRLKPSIPIARRQLQAVAAQVADQTGITVDEFRSGSRRRMLGPAKRLFASLATKSGSSLTSVAFFLNCTPASVVQLLKA